VIRLHALAEGLTEERFFKDVIAPHLAARGIFADVRMINPNPRRTARSGKGGWNSFTKANTDLTRWRSEDRTAWFTTMVDLYAIPDDFPCLDAAHKLADPCARVTMLEQAWTAANDGAANVIPYIQLHEFEALILADPQHLDGEFLEHDAAIARLVALMKDKQPEEVDGDPDTAPSKRIIAEIPQYHGRKASAGPAVAARIGLATLRARCPHFDAWLTKLEALAPQDPNP
jgi:hypothetical protein